MSNDPDIVQAREIACALCHPGGFKDKWVKYCRAGEYDHDADVQGPLLGIKIGRGLNPLEEPTCPA